MLCREWLNGWRMSPVSRWNRLISPHGVFQLPNSAWSLSDAAASDCSICSAGTLLMSPTEVKGVLLEPSGRRISSPQNTASDVGTDVTDHRRSHVRRSAICSANFALKGLLAGVSSQALSNAWLGLSNPGR